MLSAPLLVAPFHNSSRDHEHMGKATSPKRGHTTRSAANSSRTSVLFPPKSASPHVTTEPSPLKAANALSETSTTSGDLPGRDPTLTSSPSLVDSWSSLLRLTHSAWVVKKGYGADVGAPTSIFKF